MFKEYFKIAIKNIRSRSKRSWLTVFGIVIGVFLVVTLIALSEGMRAAMEGELGKMGENVIMVMPGDMGDMMMLMMGGMELRERDIRAIKAAEGVDLVVPIVWGAQLVRHQGEKKNTFLAGISVEREARDFLKKDVGWYMAEGKWPRPGRRDVFVGNIVPKDIFPGLEVGDELVIDGRKFNVVGILRSLGNRQDDSMIGLDLEIFRQITGDREGAQAAMVRASDDFDVNVVAQNIEAELDEVVRRARGMDEGVFSVITRDKMGEIAGNIILLVQVVLLGFASIAILVGIVGTMNTMYTSVQERIKEIGIMKALGAKNSMISKIFLVESGIIGMIGGIIGTLLGVIAAKSVEIFLHYAHPVMYMKAEISPLLIISTLFFSFLIGCLSGYLPARQAAKLNPVDALRRG